MLESHKPIKPLIGLGTIYRTKIERKFFRSKRIEPNDLTKREEVDPIEFQNTFEACKYSKNIRVYRLGWFMLQESEHPKLNLLSERIKGFRSLRLIEMYFYRSETITDHGYQQLMQALRGIKSLKSLQLPLSGWEFSDECMETFGRVIKRQRKLEDIRIDFPTLRKVSDSGLRKFCQGVKQRDGLKRLRFCFNGCEVISEIGMNYLSQAIGKLSLLESVYLHFSVRLQNGGKIRLKSLGQSLGTLERLKRLELFCYEFQSIKDEDLASFGEGLKGLRLLETAQIYFRKCVNITDAGFGKICEGLSELGRLKNINLDFYWCKKMTDESLFNLGRMLRKMNKLENFSLGLSYLPEISQEGLKGLKEGLMQAGNIKRINLDFSSCQKLEKDMLMEYQEELLKEMNGVESLRVWI